MHQEERESTDMYTLSCFYMQTHDWDHTKQRRGEEGGGREASEEREKISMPVHFS